MNERDKTAQMMQDSAGNSWGTEAHFQAFADLIRADEREKVLAGERIRIKQRLDTLKTAIALLKAENTELKARGNT